ncbi:MULTISPECIES: alpha/beta hydrolase [unclassified Ensifer]|uniref:alpha/beta fold hydrolase n=1 Tax=unclassified Ensifer TaxID=2633371 RepID=UPI0008130A4B|nr:MULTISPECIES: alpha/beta hydrolase [unclassified Ensifer]OCP00830.1 alpha/beta hydrolase [Ensifer sp. LC14]OCP01902.1 alpha/beta hydrolase [Ensifer sp. LC11]OCP01903.1 alpha/beta hydrolase [Ensifer sp. LC13]OCP30317.1 alpha/beta hydrolase [Ensifer sp. LC499]
MPVTHIPAIRHRFVEIDGVRLFYRESVPNGADAPTLLLLHGFPSSSHQYRRLMDALGSHYRLIAPDYPGFGHSDAPTSSTAGGQFTYSFDRLADLMEGFVDALKIERFMLYVFDFGAPVGLRLATRRPELIAGLIVQNGNACHEGLSEAARSFIALTPEDVDAGDRIEQLLTLQMTRAQYEGGTSDPERVAPDGWTMDQHFLDLPERRQPQYDLFFDYKSNLARYDEWQDWLQRNQPPTLITWGRNDPFFTEPGARAFLRDVPEAELHLFETGHFALEEYLPEIAPLIADFVDRTW